MKSITGTVLAILLPLNGYALQKKALIFGITGQDGTFLAEFLLQKNYIVHGVKRSTSSPNTYRIDYLLKNTNYNEAFFLHNGDLADANSINTLIQKIDPDEVYNLAAQSQVSVSFNMPEYTTDIDALGTLRILEAIRKNDPQKKIRFYQASSSEMFGKVQEMPQKETTRFYPRSPYGAAKVYAHWITTIYRNAYDMFACCGILFNHESHLRGETFVTRKITLAVARIYGGLQDILYLGNLDAKRDWGHAKDYVHAMWLMLQQEKPEDYVIATGETHSIREFVELAFKKIGITIAWKSKGINEVGFDRATGKVLVKIDPQYFRPAEVDLVLGDASKAHRILKWKPSISFQQLVETMVHDDILMLYNKGIIKKGI